MNRNLVLASVAGIAAGHLAVGRWLAQTVEHSFAREEQPPALRPVRIPGQRSTEPVSAPRVEAVSGR